MKRISVSIDSETLEEIVREYLAAAFPNMAVADTVFPFISEFTVRLRAKELADPALPVEPPPFRPPNAEPEEMPF